MAASAASRDRKAAPKVAIPRQLSRRQAEKPASINHNASLPIRQDSKRQTKLSYTGHELSNGPLIAATPKPTLPTTNDHFSDRQDSASSNSEFSMTTSRKDTPVSILSDFSHHPKSQAPNSSYTPTNTSPIPSTAPSEHDEDHRPKRHDSADGTHLSHQNGDLRIGEKELNHADSLNHAQSPHASNNINGRFEPPPSLSDTSARPHLWPRIDTIQPFAPTQHFMPEPLPRDHPAFPPPPPQQYHNHTISGMISPSPNLDMFQPQSQHHTLPKPGLQYPETSDNVFEPPVVEPSPPMSSYDTIGPLDWHLRRLFANQDYSDVDVEIVPAPGLDSKPRILRLHAAILSRSPRLHNQLGSAKLDKSSGRKTLQIDSTMYYRSELACVDTLWCLYNYDVASINLDAFWQRYEVLAHSRGHPFASAAAMDELVSCVATAHFLGLDTNAQAWVDMAPRIINADNAFLAVTFALQAGLDQFWLHSSDAQTKAALEHASYWKAPPPACEPYSTTLIHIVLDFMGAHLSPSFVLDTTAPPILGIDRFPPALIFVQPPPAQTNQVRPVSNTNPRLQGLRFGELPPSNDMQSEQITKALSSLLFSLPFPILKTFLEDPRLFHRLGDSFMTGLMQTIVSEREHRRHAAVEASFLMEPTQAAKVLTENLRDDLGIVEAVQKQSHPGTGTAEGLANGSATGPYGPARQLDHTHRLVCKHVPVIFP